jgi:hypothetical protein
MPAPFAAFKNERVRFADNREMFVSRRLWVPLHFRDVIGHFVMPGASALLDTGSVITRLPIPLAESFGIPVPERNAASAMRIIGAAGPAAAYWGKATIALPDSPDYEFEVDCCFTETGDYPILGCFDLDAHFILRHGQNTKNRRFGYFLDPRS